VCDWITSDCDTAELEVHARLEMARYSRDREFFRMPLKEAIKIVSEICERYDPQLKNQSQAVTRRNEGEGSFSAAFSCERCRQKYSVTIKYPENEVVCPGCHHSQPYPIEWS
jgi:hypothetical protein